MLVILPCGLPWLGRDRHPRLSNELLGCLVQTNHRAGRIVRPLVDFQHVLHRGYESGAAVRRDNPLLLQVGFEIVFFSVRPIVLSLARSTMLNSTTFSSRSCKVHRARPAGGLLQASAISFASAVPSKMRGLAEAGEYLEASAASNPSSPSR